MTSTHEAVSCDLCKKKNFRGLRYKCLACEDFDLCSTCYEAGLTGKTHSVGHPMQCIIARDDYELFYSGETLPTDQPHSLTCPFCGTHGLTESSLLLHVTNEHLNSDSDETTSAVVVCPLCGTDTNQLSFDFATHLTMEHRPQSVEQVSIRGRGTSRHARAAGSRGRRSQTHYCSVAGGSNSLPSTREPTDPLVEILAQLSGVRRPGCMLNQATQLQQLQMQLQNPSFSPRNSDFRNMRRVFQSMNNQFNNTTGPVSASNNSSAAPSTSAGYSNANSHYCGNQPFTMMEHSSFGPAMVSSATANASASCLNNANQANLSTNQADNPDLSSRYLLSECMKPALSEAEQQNKEILRADRSLFVQEMLLQIGLLGKNK